MSYIDRSAFSPMSEVKALTDGEMDMVNGGSTTSETAAHIAAITAIAGVATMEIPPLSLGLSAVSLVASAVSLWS